MSGIGTLVSLAVVFGQLSLLAFGGTNSILPEMQRQVVDLHHWLTAPEFAALFALAQAAPGPNMMVVSLIGWHVAGLPGALITTIAVSTPSSILVLLVGGVWHRFRNASWRKAVQAGLTPVTAGLVMASAALLIRSTSADWSLAAVTLVAVVAILSRKLHPLVVLAGAAAVGALGLVA
ncbi:MAG TPA: chromate transporter [Acetobacteraceae bacterium]|nr:chromate transporter [Acetobacteraceae bacterium]